MSNSDHNEHPRHEVIIIGAGVCGIYQLYRLLELGIDVTVLEAGAAPGGTWYWNRYPGARFDSESYTYGYSFSKELLEEWDWSEHFAGQPETLRYLNHVVDKRALGPTQSHQPPVGTASESCRVTVNSCAIVDELSVAESRYYQLFGACDAGGTSEGPY